MISIIVPVYNVEKYLDECVQSIVDQTYTDIEIILVNDGSKDSSGQICDSWSKKDFRIKVIHKPNGGLSSARNAALDIFKGQYVMFLDSDDYLERDALELLLHRMERDNSSFCVGNYHNIQNAELYMGTKNQEIKDDVISGLEYMKRFYSFVPFYAQVLGKLYDRRLFEELRYPVGMICEDAHLALLIAEQCDKISIIEKPIAVYRQREDSITAKSYDKIIDYDVAWMEMHIAYYKEKNERCLLGRAIHQYCYLLIEQWNGITKQQRQKYRKDFKKRCQYLIQSGETNAKQKIKYLVGICNVSLCAKLFKHGYRR